jgi:hypothetical protein
VVGSRSFAALKMQGVLQVGFLLTELRKQKIERAV